MKDDNKKKERKDYEHECPECGHVKHSEKPGGLHKCDNCGEMFTGHPKEPQP